MDTKQGKTYLILEDLDQHSIWKFSDVDDLAYPVMSADDFPEDDFDLRIRAEFLTKSGIKLRGYIVGVQDIFSIRVYIDDQTFSFNKNLPEYFIEDLNKLNKILGKSLTLSDFSPLKYTTDIDLKGFKNIEGEFDLLKKEN